MGRFTHLLPDTITYAPPSGVSTQGDATYGAQVELPARVEYDYKIVAVGDGKHRELTHWIGTETEIPLGSRVWLPGDNIGDNGVAKIATTQDSASTPDAADTLYETRV